MTMNTSITYVNQLIELRSKYEILQNRIENNWLLKENKDRFVDQASQTMAVSNIAEFDEILQAIQTANLEYNNIISTLKNSSLVSSEEIADIESAALTKDAVSFKAYNDLFNAKREQLAADYQARISKHANESDKKLDAIHEGFMNRLKDSTFGYAELITMGIQGCFTLILLPVGLPIALITTVIATIDALVTLLRMSHCINVYNQNMKNEQTNYDNSVSEALSDMQTQISSSDRDNLKQTIFNFSRVARSPFFAEINNAAKKPEPVAKPAEGSVVYPDFHAFRTAY